MKRGKASEGHTTSDDCFTRQDRVRWLAPSVLVRTVKPVLLSGLFAKFGDRREVEAVLDQGVFDLSTSEHLEDLLRARPPREVEDPGVLDELWIDYVADTGDGFDATATVASLVADRKLTLSSPAGDQVHVTEAGTLMVLGGDEVYPFASSEAYTDRFTGPFRAMLPHEEPGRVVVALPGNHDWYDGLTAFLQVFCGRSWIGGWRTVQRRSYFACQLPQRWWLWGIDIQLETYIDHPQIEYFTKAAEKIQKDDGLILCWAVPSWVKTEDEEEEAKTQAYATLDYFQRKIVPDRAHLRVALTGDSHHYARYEGPDGEQKITAGIGGAFTSATQHLPDELMLPPNRGTEPITFTRKAEYPTCPDSKAKRKGVLGAIYRNGGFPAIPALAYGSMALAVIGRSRQTARLAGGAVAGVLIGGCVAFSKPKKLSRSQCRPGLIHGSVHVAAAITAAAAAGRSTSRGRRYRDLSVFAGAAGLGGLVGPAIFAFYLIAADRRDMFRRNTNELYAAMAIEDHKGFLRLHITSKGDLEIFPIKVEKVARWKRSKKDWDEPAGAPRFEVVGEPPKPELIENRIVVSRLPRS